MHSPSNNHTTPCAIIDSIKMADDVPIAAADPPARSRSSSEKKQDITTVLDTDVLVLDWSVLR